MAFHNAEEYVDPKNYDAEFGREWKKYELFLQEAKPCQHVLELACGTGLTTLYLAERGVHIDGVDILPNMIQYAKQKNTNENARFYVGDAMTFPSAIAYDFVYLTGNAFQAFSTRDAQNSLLENVNKLLKAGGKFIFETRNPSGHDLTDCDYEYWHTFQDYEGNPVEVGGKQKYNPDTNIMKWTTIRKFQGYERESEILCLFTAPESIRKLLNEHGFDIQSEYSNWNRSPFTARMN
ncbi:class I SAM-dependent DNA methyltransferase [Brevibacillus parabrevis]|uniref:class I SAM-dependent DNA methyltransferase n=1 Tax=Brevibacillus parabrevis TaxID=54914 RepID=UPI001C239407|nr:class I SAM-dependent methyltransferase [Brevibacillus parabrevis]MBU8711765.1 class I SAM-dependent methyltransferase [Brevibacillus parabrevis]MED2257896.1 class I SAM-dependent methyltransferase [Brevibacillus parabrevis]WDV97313.1 class I SAM-dependent methyltransferase [Brevibacillus parabrevis]